MAVSGGEYSPLANLYLAAAEELGYNVTDYNGDTQEGFSKIQFNSREGVRDSSAVAYLGRVGKRSNLDIVINTVVTKVDIKDKIATGVFYIRNGRKHFVKAKREVVLSSGAINTPQLLMLSGVGPKDHLKELNIPVVVDLPVGNNLHDHQTVLLPTTINQPIGVTPSELFSFKNHLQYRLFGTGPLAKSEIEVTAFLHADETKRQKTAPDFQVFLVSFLIPFSSYEYKDTVNAKLKVHDEDVHGFTAVLCNTHPKSRGTIRLRSIDPFDHPIIDPLNFYDKRDVEELVSGIRTWEKYLQTPTMKALGVNIEDLKMYICSEHDFPSDEYWECFVRNLAVSVYHICGTCKMGHRDDQNAVVDPQLRVRGIERLRVVDASIFPKITTGNTNAPVVMVAEKAADMILGIDSVKELKEILPHGV